MEAFYENPTPSKKPKALNKPRWGEAELQLFLKIRRENPTYGKEKIAVILNQDHAQLFYLRA